MYNIDRPLLVFSHPCHLPYTEQFYGWGFNLYEFNADKPRGLFFSHVSEAVMFARRLDAAFSMEPELAPERVSALEYVLSRQEESDYPVAPEDGRTSEAARERQRGRAQLVQLAAARAGVSVGTADVAELLGIEPTDDEPGDIETEGRYGIDWAGSTTHYRGGRTPRHIHDDSGVGSVGHDAAEAIDWFGDD